MVASTDGKWLSCKVAEKKCFRYDDGALMARVNEDSGKIERFLPGQRNSQGVLEVTALTDVTHFVDEKSSTPVTPINKLITEGGKAYPFSLRLKNKGVERLYGVTISSSSAETVQFYPPPSVVVLEPGETVKLKAMVSVSSTFENPKKTLYSLNLKAESLSGVKSSIQLSLINHPPEPGIGEKILRYSGLQWIGNRLIIIWNIYSASILTISILLSFGFFCRLIYTKAKA